VVFVPDLNAAVDAYCRQGFAVQPGGRHEGSPTHNALVGCADGSYVELISTTNRLLPAGLRILGSLRLLDRALLGRSPLQRRFFRGFAAGSGIADYCLWTDTLDEAVDAARSRGIDVEGPVRMGRDRPDGRRLEWRLALPSGAGLPFLIEDCTPRDARVPPAVRRPGTLLTRRTEQICVSVPDLPRSVDRLSRLLGIEPLPNNNGERAFQVGRTRIVLCAGKPGSRRAGPARLTLAVAPSPSPLLPAVERHGIRLVGAEDA